MNKESFLSALRERLSALPQTDIENTMDFYAEMLDDRIESGMTEEDAVREIGSPEAIAAQIVADTPLPRLVRESLRPRRRLRAWEIVLLILGSPVWLPLLISAGAVLLSAYFVVWSCAFVLYAADLSLAACVPAALFAAAVCLREIGLYPAGCYLGLSLVCAGLAVFLFFGCNYVAKGIARGTRAIALRIKARFVRKEASV